MVLLRLCKPVCKPEIKKLFKFMSLKFYRTFLECFFIFQRRIAGYVTAKKGKQTKKGIKRQALLADNVNDIFERNLNSF